MGQVGKFVILTRIGFAARGLIYILIGYLALASGRTEDSAGILEYLNGGAGKLLLALIAAGLVGYGAWRLIDAGFDTQGRGSDAKGVALRFGGAVSGLVHLGLAFLAASLVAGGNSEGGSAEKAGAEAALALPGGGMLLLAVAAALFAAGLFQIVKAVRVEFLRHLDPDAARRPWIAWIGRAGFVARSAVFLIIALSLWRAGYRERAGEAQGAGEALAALPGNLQLAVAGGLVLFGMFSLVEARYRQINDPHVVSRLRSVGDSLH